MIGGSYDNSMFSFIRNHQTIFPSGFPFCFFHSNTCVPVAPGPHQHLMWSGVWILGTLIGGWWCPVVVLISNSLITCDVEQLFLGLFTSVFLHLKASVEVFSPFLNWVVCFFLIVEFTSTLCILDHSPS